MRKFNQSKKDEYNLPGPAQYQIRERSYKIKKENYTANFASGTKRNEIPIEVRFYFNLKLVHKMKTNEMKGYTWSNCIRCS